MTFIQRFLDVVHAYPQHVALDAYDTGPITYHELAQWARSFAYVLRAAGVGPEVMVGIALERSAALVAVELAVWWAGGAFVPMDARWPEERVAFVVRDAGFVVAVATGTRADPLRALGITVLEPHAPAHAFAPHSTQPHDLAYVIYTSGSTGQPKGVLVEHGGIVPLLDAQIRAFQLGPVARSLWLLSPAFDASISDVGTTLLAGGTLVIARGDQLREPTALTEQLHQKRITYVDLPPVYLTLLDRDAMPTSLQTICIGGEPASPTMVRHWAERFRLVNVYGPTEATVCTSWCVCTPTWDEPRLGQPLPGINYAVAESGELLISGQGLARGYHRRPELTATKFFERAGTRWYRTGDRVAWRGGEYVFLGRLDRQFKLHGQLIEPDEIEQCLRTHPAVAQAAVVKHGPAERSRLVAFVTPSAPVTPTELRAHARQVLPPWMVPNHVEFITLPRTPNGKVDEDALRSWVLTAVPATHPATNTLLQICSRVLQRPLDLQQSFYAQGGDSLRAMECVARAQALGLTIPVSVLATEQPLEHFADWLATPTDTLRTTALARDVQTLVAQLPAVHRTHTIPEPTVFLTGATGFLGSWVLKALAQRQTPVVCLVRAPSHAVAYERLRLPATLQQRVRVVLGDLALPSLGLDQSTWDDLAATVRTIYHLGANVNMVAPYTALRAANVGGTATLLRLMATGGAKCLHHASTLSVFLDSDDSTPDCREDDDWSNLQTIVGGYAQSKWAAERLLREVGERYGPVAYYRFGMLTGPRPTGEAHMADNLNRLGQGLLQLGGYRATSEMNMSIDLTPVTYAAAAMLDIADQAPPSGATFHLANHRAVTFAQVVEAFAVVGHPLAALDEPEWTRRLEWLWGLAPTSAALCQALPTPHRAVFQAAPRRFHTTNTQKALAETGLVCPGPEVALAEWVAMLVREHERSGTPPWRPDP